MTSKQMRRVAPPFEFDLRQPEPGETSAVSMTAGFIPGLTTTNRLPQIAEAPNHLRRDANDRQNPKNERRHEQANSFGIKVTNIQVVEHSFSAFSPLLSDKELAKILITSVPWVRAHAKDIPGFERLGDYYRFRCVAIEQWLGSLERLLEVVQVAALLKVPKSWVYANADDIPGVLRLGGYVRFRPAVIRQFLGGSGVAQ